MSTAIGPYRLGKHLTSVAFSTLTPDETTGVFSTVNTYDVTAFEDETGMETRRELVDIRPVNGTTINMVETGVGGAARLVTLKRARSANALYALEVDAAAGASHVLLNWTEGNETFSGLYKIGNQTSGTRGRGQQVIEQQLEPAALNGAAQVSYSAA